jgi:enoyl-CoA hydratase/carnithine racemase
MGSSLLVVDKGAVRVLTLNRPARLNALDAGLREKLIDALAGAADDGAVRAVMITGAGDRAFCAGQDLNESSAIDGADEGDWIGTWRRMFMAFLTHPKPIVAAVNGVAAGGGLEIAMFSDIRIAVPAARFIMAEINIGLPTLIGSYFLNVHLHESRMREIVLSGRTIGAEEAHEIGLVHRLAGPDTICDEALAFARDIAAKPPRAMALNIRRFRQGMLEAVERDGVFEALIRYQGEAMASGEPQHVMAEFLAGRARRKQTETNTS